MEDLAAEAVVENVDATVVDQASVVAEEVPAVEATEAAAVVSEEIPAESTDTASPVVEEEVVEEITDEVSQSVVAEEPAAQVADETTIDDVSVEA